MSRARIRLRLAASVEAEIAPGQDAFTVARERMAKAAQACAPQGITFVERAAIARDEYHLGNATDESTLCCGVDIYMDPDPRGDDLRDLDEIVRSHSVADVVRAIASLLRANEWKPENGEALGRAASILFDASAKVQAIANELGPQEGCSTSEA